MPDVTHSGRQRIAIIGGGLSGAALLLALLRQDDAADVIVYEPEAEVGPGLAYGAAAPWHLLNVVATRASLFEDDPDHWWRWARDHGPELGWPDLAEIAAPDAYLPRRLYGYYIVAQLEKARQRHGNRTVVHHRSPAVSLERQEEGFIVIDRDGGAAHYDTVILATGAPAASPLDFSGLAQLRSADRWYDDPWDLSRLKRIQRDQAVLVVGSALTMADAILSLQQQGHRGHIHVLSRHGVVPSARCEQSPLPTGLSADDGSLPLSWLLRRLRRAVQIHGLENWQGVFEGLRGFTNDLWCSLPTAVQRRFMRHLKAHWDAHRFRMPPSTARCLQQLQAEQRLQFHKGRLQEVVMGYDHAMIRYRPRGSQHAAPLWVHAVVDCTGPRRPELDWAGRLLEALKTNGLLARSPSGSGIDATAQGRVIDPQGHAIPGLHVIGPPLRGPLLESTAISDLRSQANALARDLASAADRQRFRSLAQ